MEGSPESKKPKRQLNIRLSDETFERLRAWAFLEGCQHPGPFATRIIEAAIEGAVADISQIDALVQLSAEGVPNEQ